MEPRSAAPVQQGRTLLIKSPQQVAILNELYERGMHTLQARDLVVEAIQNTGLPRLTIKDWMSNKRKALRGRIKRRGKLAKYNEYTAFLTLPQTAYHGNRDEIGTMSSSRALEYRRQQETQEGRDFLKENLRQCNAKQDSLTLTSVQAHNYALGIYKRIQNESRALAKLGYKAVTIIAQPSKDPTMLGLPAAVYFFRNRMPIIREYELQMNTGKEADETRSTLRQRVQEIFNGLYSRSFVKSAMPYSAIESGQVQLEVKGLPEGTHFKRPSMYTVQELKNIIEGQDLLTLIPQCDVEPCNNQDDDASPNFGGASAACTKQSKQQDDQAEVSSALIEKAVSCDKVDSISEACLSDEVPVLFLHGEEDDIEESSVLSEFRIIVPRNDADEDIITTVDHPSRQESMVFGQQLADIQRKQTAAKKRTKKQRGNAHKKPFISNQCDNDDLVGKRVNQQYIVSKPGKKEVRKWFKGTIRAQTKDSMVIKYDKPSGEICTHSKEAFNAFIKEKTMRFL